MKDFAQQMRWMVDDAYPKVSVIRQMLDSLNTHRVTSLYEAFPTPEASRIANRLEAYYISKHGHCLNAEEMEFNVLAWVCLLGQNPDGESLAGR